MREARCHKRTPYIRGMSTRTDVGLQDAKRRGEEVENQQKVSDRNVRGSIGSVGEANDNAMAASFVDTLKIELISDRI